MWGDDTLTWWTGLYFNQRSWASAAWDNWIGLWMISLGRWVYLFVERHLHVIVGWLEPSIVLTVHHIPSPRCSINRAYGFPGQQITFSRALTDNNVVWLCSCQCHVSKTAGDNFCLTCLQINNRSYFLSFSHSHELDYRCEHDPASIM